MTQAAASWARMGETQTLNGRTEGLVNSYCCRLGSPGSPTGHPEKDEPNKPGLVVRTDSQRRARGPWTRMWGDALTMFRPSISPLISSGHRSAGTSQAIRRYLGLEFGGGQMGGSAAGSKEGGLGKGTQVQVSVVSKQGVFAGDWRCHLTGN